MTGYGLIEFLQGMSPEQKALPVKIWDPEYMEHLEVEGAYLLGAYTELSTEKFE